MTTRDQSNIPQEIAAHLARADHARAAGLGDAVQEAEALLLTLRIERARLAFQLGPTAPAVQDMDARLAAEEESRLELVAEHQRSRVGIPKSQVGTAIIHGRVVDAAGGGLTGISVNASTADGKNKATAKTSTIGHFVVSFAAEQQAAILLELVQGDKMVYRDRDARVVKAGTAVYAEVLVEEEKTVKPAEKPVRPKPPVAGRRRG